MATIKFIRSENALLQSMCALVEIGPPIRGALNEKRFDIIDKVIDNWNTISKIIKDGEEFPRFFRRTAESLDVKPDWVSEPRAVYTYDKQTGKYLEHSPSVAMASYDQPHVIKGMCICAAALKSSSIVCGAPADLARYKVIWFNNTFCTKTGTLYVSWLRQACFSGDTLALDVYKEDAKIAALPNNHDTDVWTPFVLLSLRCGIKSDADAIANYLFSRFGTRWSKSMINACLGIIKTSGYMDRLTIKNN